MKVMRFFVVFKDYVTFRQYNMIYITISDCKASNYLLFEYFLKAVALL